MAARKKTVRTTAKDAVAKARKKSASTKSTATAKRSDTTQAPKASAGAFTNGSAGPRPVPCLQCGLCCTYIAVDVDPPTTVRRATQMLWYLYHSQVSVYWDNDEEWLLQFETRCRHLQLDNACAIYEQRPHICRDFDERACEVNAEDEGTSFHSAPEFIEFLKTRRKALYRKLEEGGHIPAAQTLEGPPANPARLAPFDKRFRKLRVLGGH